MEGTRVALTAEVDWEAALGKAAVLRVMMEAYVVEGRVRGISSMASQALQRSHRRCPDHSTCYTLRLAREK